jgi:type IV/VI secretion system ImpK/VasF family protein
MQPSFRRAGVDPGAVLMDRARDYTTQLFRLATPLFLFLVSFRRKVEKKYPVSQASVIQDLDEIFTAMSRNVRNEPRLDALYDRVKYPLVVLADEILLHSNWEHAESWRRDHLLEEKMFGTNIGGNKFFTMASELKHEEVEVASILFTAISLGFRGSLRDRPEMLSEIRGKLYRQMSEYLADAHPELTPEAYHVKATELRKLSPAVTLGRVAVVCASLLLFYWVASWLVWGTAVSQLRDVVNGFMAGGGL